MALKKIKLTVLVPVLAGFLLLAFGGYGLYMRWKSTHQPHSPETVNRMADTTVTNSTNTPDETPIAESPSYTVPADMPRQITLSSLGVKGYIQRVGIDQRNAIAVPSNINLAGWYTGSAKPGEKGLSIIDGHVSGRYSDAIFKNLGSLKISDTFKIEYGDKSVRTFEVVDIKTVSVADAAKELFAPNPAIANQLNLITCGGKFDSRTQEFDKRVIVIAKLENI